MEYRLARITAASLALKISVNGQMKFMNTHGFHVTMISSDGPELAEVKAIEQCPHISVHISRKITPLGDLKTIYRLYRIFKKTRPHIIHSNNLKANLLGMIAGWLAGIPVRIQTMAGLVSPNFGGIKGKLIRNAEMISFRFATNVWPNSNSSLQYMLNTKMLPATKAKVIGGGSTNGIDTTKYNKAAIKEERLQLVKEMIGFSTGDRILLFAGRMVKDKGIEELIRIFPQLQNEFGSLKLVLLGPEEAELDPLTVHTKNEIESNDRIIHINWTDELQYYFDLAELFVFPSHREGFPNVLMQAGAMQCPVVCSEIIGNTDIVQHKINGLLHQVKDETSLYSNIVFALNNREQMKRMSDKLYQDIMTGYDKATLYEQYRQEYFSLLKEKGVTTS